MTFKKILQTELKEKGKLTIDDVQRLCVIHDHYLDTARRALEPDNTPYAEKTIINGHIKFWTMINVNSAKFPKKPLDVEFARQKRVTADKWCRHLDTPELVKEMQGNQVIETPYCPKCKKPLNYIDLKNREATLAKLAKLPL